MAHCRSRDNDAGNHRLGARGWVVTAFLAVLGAAIGWVLLTRRRGQQAISGDPWATPAPSALAAVSPAETAAPTRTAPPAAALGLAATAPVPPSGEPSSEHPADGAGADEEPAATPAGGGTTPAPYGDGSAAPLADGSAPEGFTIKGNANSMLFHPTDSPYYGRTRAGVWFRDEDSAMSAGFRRWDHKRRS